jgi:hypothetical protein
MLLDGNTEAAFSAELVTAVSTEIRMGFVWVKTFLTIRTNNSKSVLRTARRGA